MIMCVGFMLKNCIFERRPVTEKIFPETSGSAHCPQSAPARTAPLENSESGTNARQTDQSDNQ